MKCQSRIAVFKKMILTSYQFH